MAALKSENAISDNLGTSKFLSPFQNVNTQKVDPEVFYTPPKYLGMCAPDHKLF
jgi:hypothetical protein